MTDYVPQTSASDRYEAARKALDAWDNGGTVSPVYVIEKFRALITPPSVGESAERIAERIAMMYGNILLPMQLVEAAVNAGIQSAHETWEPEVALRPTQEQMLRWLGIKYDDRPLNSGNVIAIYQQTIDKED